MSRKNVSEMILTMLLVCTLTLVFDIQPAKADPGTIIVPDDYLAIQEAINNANEGDTIYVRNGTYYENVVVNKTVSLIGEDKSYTIIEGNDSISGHGLAGINATVDNVVVSGFNISNHSFGVFLCQIVNVTIMNNSFCGNYDGVWLNGTASSLIKNNVIIDSGRGGVVSWFHSQYDTISNNTVKNNEYGIVLFKSSHNSIRDNIAVENAVVGVSICDNASENNVVSNTINNNGEWGIILGLANNNTFIFNEISGNGYDSSDYGSGIYLERSANNSIYMNNFIDNYQQVYIYYILEEPSQPNMWDDGYPSGGNYWSNYNGTDLCSGPHQNLTSTDGIGDMPYIIDENNTDSYPLMQPYQGPVRNLNTGQSYSTIQEAINNATDGDGIFALSGTYYERVVVNKTVSLMGENKSDTIVESRNDTVFEIRASGIELSNFKIVGTPTSLTNYGAAIYSENSYIHDNIFFSPNGVIGIYANYGDNNLLMQNLFGGTGQWRSMEILQSRNCTIASNSVNGGYYGISIVNGYVEPGGHTIFNNTITNVIGHALWLWDSDNNTITANNFSYCGYGVSLTSCTSTIYSNHFIENTITYNSVGMKTQSSKRQIFYHNNFINNTRQIYDFSWDYPEIPTSINIWDNGCEGNYWSDYNGTDPNEDGTGDTPYTIDGNNSDRYPLMNPYWNPTDINHDLKVDIKDITIAALAYGSYPGDHNWNCHADITGPTNLVPDGKVDIRDIALIAIHYGEIYT